ncbi:MAG: toast rack family protein [Chloroflexota bacterium]
MLPKIFAFVTVLALATLACGVQINPPATPGPDVTETINVPVPEGEGVSLRLEFGAGKLTLAPGAATALVEGTATYNIPDLKPDIQTSGSRVTMSVGKYQAQNFPRFNNLKNVWDLRLGAAPMDLTIAAGAYEADYDFGGLALTNLTVQDGASDVELGFSSPNQAEMAVLRYETGASTVKLSGLSNANFSTMIFQGGAGNYSLDFSGEVQREATISVETGVSNLTLIVPDGVNARLTIEGSLSNVTSGSGWDKDGNTYTHAGEGPLLTFVIEIGAGNLILE